MKPMPNFLMSKQPPTDIDKLRKLETFDTKEKINNHVSFVAKTDSFISEVKSSLDDPQKNENEDEYVLRMRKKITKLLMKKLGF